MAIAMKLAFRVFFIEMVFSMSILIAFCLWFLILLVPSAASLTRATPDAPFDVGIIANSWQKRSLKHPIVRFRLAGTETVMAHSIDLDSPEGVSDGAYPSENLRLRFERSLIADPASVRFLLMKDGQIFNSSHRQFVPKYVVLSRIGTEVTMFRPHKKNPNLSNIENEYAVDYTVNCDQLTLFPEAIDVAILAAFGHFFTGVYERIEADQMVYGHRLADHGIIEDGNRHKFRVVRYLATKSDPKDVVELWCDEDNGFRVQRMIIQYDDVILADISMSFGYESGREIMQSIQVRQFSLDGGKLTNVQDAVVEEIDFPLSIDSSAFEILPSHQVWCRDQISGEVFKSQGGDVPARKGPWLIFTAASLVVLIVVYLLRCKRFSEA
jgi:hypothetical protein